MNKFILPIFIFLFPVSLIAQKITIAVAANAQYAMKEIEKQYEKQKGIEIDLIVGSSGKLTAQIREGAPFDIFLSADMDFPEALFKENLTIGKPRVYGNGTLVLWTAGNVPIKDVISLLDIKLKHIALANPKLAPYGEAAISVLNYYKIFSKVESKLIFGESLSQVSQFVYSGAAEVGFTAKSLVLSPEMAGKGTWIELDKKSYEPISQSAVLLKSSLKDNKKAAEDFYNFLYSSEAKKIFRKFGYLIPA